MTWSEAAGRAIVYARSQGRCEVCGRQAHSVQHRVKRSQGGTWAPSNLLHVCGDGTRYCHGWIEGHPTHAIALGLWLPATAVPSEWPAYLHPTMWQRGWWRLDDHGCWHFAHPPEDYETRPEIAAAITALTAARLLADQV